MKKFYSLAIALASLLVSSCANEKLNEPAQPGTLRYEVSTETFGRATHDGDGEAANVNRFVCQAFLVDDPTSPVEAGDRIIVAPTVKDGKKTATFDLNLPTGHSYTVYFWADNGKAEDKSDLYYNTSYMYGGVTRVDMLVGNNDALDAFYATDAIAGETFRGALTKSVTLKRAVAQVNVITTDAKAVQDLGLFPTKINLTYKASNKFDLVSGKASPETTDYVEFSYTGAPYKTTETTVDEKKYCTLAMNYLFTTGGIEEKTVEDVKFKAYKGETEVVKKEFTNIPFQRNYRTNIVGNLLTAGAHYDVDLDQNWAGNLTTVANIAAANEALKTSSNVEVEMPSDAKTVAVVIPVQQENKDVTLNFLGDVTGGTLTIKLEDATKDPQTLTITAPSGTSLVFEHATHVVINGTYYPVVEGEFSANTLVIEKGVTVGTLVPKKGKIEIHGTVNAIDFTNEEVANCVKFGKSEGLSEDLRYNKITDARLADGYDWEENADHTWNIVKMVPVAMINGKGYETLADAFADVEAGQTIEILKAGEYSLPSPISNITIKGIAEGGAVIFKGIDNYGASTSKLHGVVFEGVSFKFGTSLYTGFQHSEEVTFNKCEFTGRFNSYGKMTFNNCKMTSPTGDYAMWLYAGDVTFNGCEFFSDGKIFNVYNEGNERTVGEGENEIKIPWKIVTNNCTFNSTKKNKAALNIKATCGAKILHWDVTINNCTVKDPSMFPAASGDATSALYVGGPIWQVDDRTSAAIEANAVKVTVDGVVVYGGE